MHKGMRRKLKVYAVDAAMVFLAFQLTAVIKGGKMEIAAMPSQGVVFEEREEIQIPEGWGETETETHDTSGSLIYGCTVYAKSGKMKAKVGDYIIRDPSGAVRICKAKEFREEYERMQGDGA